MNIRITGLNYEIEELAKRLSLVCDFHLRDEIYKVDRDRISGNHSNLMNPPIPEDKEVRRYANAYLLKNSLYDLFQAEKQRSNDLEIELELALQEITRLKEFLNLIPKPQNYDAVLSPNSK